MRLKSIILAVICLTTISATAWAIGIAGSAGGKRVTVAVDGTWQGTYAAGTTYASGDIVTDGTTNYRSLQAGNVGHTPSSSPTYWQAVLAKGDTGPTGSTGPQGATGPAGSDGRTVLTTSGAPASGTGVDGDYAYDPATFLMYGPKASGAWPAGTLLKGTDGNGVGTGSDGTYGWYTGNNTSSYTDCTSGRYGLNFVGGELYACKNGTNTLFTGGGTIGGSTGSTDRAVLIASGTGGATIQASGVTIDGNGVITTPKVSGTADKITLASSNSTDTTGAGFMGPSSAAANTYWMQLPATEPTNGQILTAGTPSSHVVPMSWGSASGSMTWPSAAGIAVYGGSSAWGTSLTAPSGALVGTTDTQTLSDKTLTGPKETVTTGGTCSTSYNVDPAAGTMITLTLSGACEIGVTNLAAGHSFTVYLTQSSTTAPTFTSAYKWATGTVPTWSTAATKYDTIACGSPDGTKLICAAVIDGR